MIGECKTTSQICYETGESPENVRPNLIRLHHLGIVEPVGVCTHDAPLPIRQSYYDDLLWDLSDHGRNHNASVVGCRACWFREKLILDNCGLVE